MWQYIRKYILLMYVFSWCCQVVVIPVLSQHEIYVLPLLLVELHVANIIVVYTQVQQVTPGHQTQKHWGSCISQRKKTLGLKISPKKYSVRLSAFIYPLKERCFEERARATIQGQLFLHFFPSRTLKFNFCLFFYQNSPVIFHS